MTVSALAGLVAATLGFSASAHHSTAIFEWGTEKQVAGTVEEFQWTQPHGFIWLDVSGNAGKSEQWGFEGMSPSWLGRHNWTSRSLSAGEKIRVTYYPLKDGRRGGFFVRVELPGGKTLQALPDGPVRVPPLP
jgi:hypothetical protein